VLIINISYGIECDKYISKDGTKCIGDCNEDNTVTDLTSITVPTQCKDECPVGTYVVNAPYRGKYCIGTCPLVLGQGGVPDDDAWRSTVFHYSFKYISYDGKNCIGSCPTNQRPVDNQCYPNGQCPEGYRINDKGECTKSIVANINENIPRSRYNKLVGWGIDYYEDNNNTFINNNNYNNKNIFFLTGKMEGVSYKDSTPIVPLYLLRDIDTKIDDGLPKSGSIRTLDNNCIKDNNTNNTINEYKESNNTNNKELCRVILDAGVVY
jgi:hypothetical protein